MMPDRHDCGKAIIGGRSAISAALKALPANNLVLDGELVRLR
jgi:hypothetical protein